MSLGFWTQLCGPCLLPLSFHFVSPQAVIEHMMRSLIAKQSAPLHQSISRQLGRQTDTSQMYRVLPSPRKRQRQRGFKTSIDLSLARLFPYTDGFESSQRDILNNANLRRQQSPQKSSPGLVEESPGTSITHVAMSSITCSSADPEAAPEPARAHRHEREVQRKMAKPTQESHGLLLPTVFFYLLLP